MDKVYRYFEVQELLIQESSGAKQCFIMHSLIEGEFGKIHIETVAEIPGKYIVQEVKESSGTPDDDLYTARLSEMQYFVSLLPMFNPKLQMDYGLSESEAPQSAQF